MELITREGLDRYLARDSIADWMDRISEEGDQGLTCQRWLRDTPPNG